MSHRHQRHAEEHAPDGQTTATRVHLRRYRKRRGQWHVHSRMTLTSGPQALALLDALSAWGERLDPHDDGPDDGEEPAATS